MKKLRKWISIMFCLCCLVACPVQAIDVTGEMNTDIQIGKVNYSLSENGEEMLDDLAVATSSIASVSITDQEMTFSGVINYSHTSTPFMISGSMWKSRTFENHLFVDANDNSGNFDVISLVYIKNAQSTDLFICPELEGKDVLRLFLMKKGTREFSMFEFDIENFSQTFSCVNDLENNFDQYSICQENLDEIWWTKVFVPEIENVAEPLKAGSTDSKTFTYEDGTGNQYKYVITVKAESHIFNFPSGGSSEEDDYYFYISSQKFYHNGVESSTPYLGVYNLKCRAVLTNTGMTNKDRIIKASWGGTFTQTTGGWSGSVQIQAGVLNVLGASLTWSSYQTITTSIGQIANITGDYQGMTIPCVKALKNVNDQFIVSIKKEKVTSGTKVSGAVFYYKLGFTESDNFYSGSLTTSGTYT